VLLALCCLHLVCIKRLIEVQLQLSDAKSQVLVLQEANDELAKANNLLENENVHLESNLQNANKKIEDLANAQNEVQRLKEVEKTNHVEIVGMKDRICKYAAADQKLKQELSETNRKLQEMQQTCMDLQREVTALKEKDVELRTALRHQECAAESSRLDLNETKAALDAAEQQLAAAEKREKEATALTNRSKEETRTVMAEMTSKLENSCNEVRLEMERTHKIDIDLISKDMKRVAEENCRLVVKLEHYSEQLEEVKSRNNVIDTENKKVRASLKEEKRQTELLQSQLRKVSMITCHRYMLYV
jgi:chromosome segregation ATPase